MTDYLDKAVEALAKRRYTENALEVEYPPVWDDENPVHRRLWLESAERDLSHAAPTIQAQERERIREALVAYIANLTLDRRDTGDVIPWSVVEEIPAFVLDSLEESHD